MHRILFRSLLALLLLLVAVPLAADEGIFPYPVHQRTLDNGMKTIVIPMPADGLVAYWHIVRTGSREEVEPGVTGFAHFFEHMMFRGSENFSQEEREAIVASMGADANGFTTSDYTGYYLLITREDLERCVEIESDRFLRLTYDEPTFRTESGAVYGEYRKSRTSPFSVLNEAELNTAFDAHTYKHTVIGFEADIEQMPEQYEYSKTFLDRFYRPENVVVMVVGDVDPEETFRLVEAGYSEWEPGYVEPEVPVEPEQTEARRVEVAFEGQTLPILDLAFKGPAYDPADRVTIATYLLGELAFGPTSDVYRELVLEENRLQFLNPSFSPSRDPRLLSVTSRVLDPADVAAIEGELWAVVDRFRREPPSQEALDRVRSQYKYGFLSGLSTPQGVAGSIAQQVAITGGFEAVEIAYGETLDAVTPEDVQTAAQRYLRPEGSTTAVLYPADSPLPEAELAAEPALYPVPSDPNVTMGLWFDVGSQDDPEGKEGLANLVAEMLTEGGSADRTYQELIEAMTPLAAGFWGTVDKEQTVLNGRVHRDLVTPFFDLFTEPTLDPGFRPGDFERLKKRAIDRLSKQMRYSSDEELGKAVLYETIFDATPYEHHVLGTVAGLESITLEDVKAFYAKYFTRDNVVLALAGAYDDRLQARLTAELARLPGGDPEKPAAPAPAAIEGRQVVLVEKPGDSTAISFGYPIDLIRGQRDFYALWVANSWLGEHRNSVSHLYQVIRADRGINYGDYSYIEAFPGGGFRNMPPTGVGRRQQLFEVWIRPVPRERALFSLRAALREVERLAENGLTQEQFTAQRDFLKKYILQFATTSTTKLGYRLDDRFYGLDGEGHLARFQEMLDSLTLEEVNAAVRKYLQVDDLVIAMITEDAAGLKADMVADAVSPIDYGGLEKPAEILAEDAEIERYPLEVEAENVRVVPVEQIFAD